MIYLRLLPVKHGEREKKSSALGVSILRSNRGITLDADDSVGGPVISQL